ncbi:MAG TPA: hypothetical protein VHC22_14620 [Pirellulales bacterium]|nr:hypothetical protein [Pirellulales bacterium]
MSSNGALKSSRLMQRPQFTIRTLLVGMLVVAVFFGGMAVQRMLARPVGRHHQSLGGGNGRIEIEWTEMRDGTKWYKMAPDGELVLWNEPISNAPDDNGQCVVDLMRLPDGSHWQRVEDYPSTASLLRKDVVVVDGRCGNVLRRSPFRLYSALETSAQLGLR